MNSLNIKTKGAALALSLVLLSCGSTDQPEVSETAVGDFLVNGLDQESGVFTVADDSQFGTGVSREDIFASPEAESNITFQLSLSEVGEDKGVILYVNTDGDLRAGYAVQFSLDSHHPGEVNVVVSVLVDGEEQGGHFHLLDDVEVPAQLSLSLEAHPSEPHFVIMDQSSGNPTQNILFDSEKSIANLKAARLGQKLGFRIGRGASLSPPRPGPSLLEE